MLGDYLRWGFEPEPERVLVVGFRPRLFDIEGHPWEDSLIKSGERLE